jgi:uncharacterized protein YciW
MPELEMPDVMDRLAGVTPGSALFELRRARPDVVRHAQGSDAALFAPKDDGGLSPAERAAAALRVAVLLRDEVLQDHYRARLAELGGAGPEDRRWAVIRAHIERVTIDPHSAARRDLDALRAAGLSPHGIVSLSQLIAYVNFQARVLAGLRMLQPIE